MTVNPFDRISGHTPIDYRYVLTANGWKWVPVRIARLIWAEQRRQDDVRAEAMLASAPKRRAA